MGDPLGGAPMLSVDSEAVPGEADRGVTRQACYKALATA